MVQGQAVDSEETMLINEIAAKVGVGIDTIRYYEKRGLLDEQHFTRAANNYRHYNNAAVERLTLIRNAQAAGITLSEMEQYINEWETEKISSADKVAFFAEKMQQIDERIAALIAVKTYLTTKLRMVEAGTI
jgi:DNA-binding transcriptional MerR regulator